MKPRKSWEPDYRFGGDRTDIYRPAPLGTKYGYGPIKPKAKKAKKR